jgi:hypothetical protein
MMGVFKVVDGELRIVDEIREILPFGCRQIGEDLQVLCLAVMASLN